MVSYGWESVFLQDNKSYGILSVATRNHCMVISFKKCWKKIKQHCFRRHEILLTNKITKRPKAILILKIDSHDQLFKNVLWTYIYNFFIKMRSSISGVHKCANLKQEKQVGNDDYYYNLHFSKMSTEIFTLSLTLKYSENSSLWPDPND